MGLLGNTNLGSVFQQIEDKALGSNNYVAPADGFFTKLIAYIRHDPSASNVIHHTQIVTGAIFDLDTGIKVAETVPFSIDTQSSLSGYQSFSLKQEGAMVREHHYLFIVGAQRYGYQTYVYCQSIPGMPAEDHPYTMELVDTSADGEPISYDIRNGFPSVYGQGAIWGRMLDYSLKACIYAEYRLPTEPPPPAPTPQLRTVTVMPYLGGESNPARGTYKWYDGEQHLITALPASGYTVDYWTLNDVTITTPDIYHYWLVVQGDEAVSIHFKVGTAPPVPPIPPAPSPTPTPSGIGLIPVVIGIGILIYLFFSSKK